MHLYVIDDGGFTFGMDAVTPVSWTLRKPRRCYTSLQVAPHQRKQVRAVFAGRDVVVASHNELVAQVRAQP